MLTKVPYVDSRFVIECRCSKNIHGLVLVDIPLDMHGRDISCDQTSSLRYDRWVLIGYTKLDPSRLRCRLDGRILIRCCRRDILQSGFELTDPLNEGLVCCSAYVVSMTSGSPTELIVPFSRATF